MIVWERTYRLMEERYKDAESRAREAELAVKVLTDVVDRLTRPQPVVPAGEPNEMPAPFPPPIAMAIAEQRVGPAEMRRLTRWARDQQRLGMDPVNIANTISLGMAE